MENFVTIEILGQPFTFKTESELSEARAVADYLKSQVNKMEGQIIKNSPGINKRTVLLLTALNITGEYFALKKKHEDLKKIVSERSRRLVNALESQLASYEKRQ